MSARWADVEGVEASGWSSRDAIPVLPRSLGTASSPTAVARLDDCLSPFLKAGGTTPRQGWRRSKGKNTPHPEILLRYLPTYTSTHPPCTSTAKSGLELFDMLHLVSTCMHAAIHSYQSALCCSLRIRAVTNDSWLSRVSRLSPWSPLSPLFITLPFDGEGFLFRHLNRESSSVH